LKIETNSIVENSEVANNNPHPNYSRPKPASGNPDAS
jgi:hypothetical protein